LQALAVLGALAVVCVLGTLQLFVHVEPLNGSPKRYLKQMVVKRAVNHSPSNPAAKGPAPAQAQAPAPAPAQAPAQAPAPDQVVTATALIKNASPVKNATTLKNMDLVVIILNARGFKDRRIAIRETWGNEHSNVFFIVGKHCPYRPDQRKPWVCEPKNKNAKIDVNYNAQQDILTAQLSKEPNVIVVDLIDVYRHLAEKLKLAYAWIVEHTNAKYVLKMDDDSFARVDSAQHWLANRANPPKYEIIAGAFSRGSPSRSGKWAEIKYRPSTYPPWPSGAGHIVSRPVIEYMHKNLDTWVSYQGEDTSMGIWMEKVRPQINVRRTKSEHFTTHSGDCHNKKKFVIGHSISIQKLRACYQTMDEYEHVQKDDVLDKDVCKNKPSGARWIPFTSMVNVLNKLNANYTISTGTVLSWYRDCSLGSSDVDMNIDLDWFKKNQDRLRKALLASGWRQKYTFGTFGDVGYEESWTKNGVKTDLFSVAYVDGRYINGLTIAGKVYPCNQFLERYETHTWNGISFQVPAPIEPYLRGLYGNWRKKHIHNYVWDVEPFKTDNGRRFCYRDVDEMKKLQLKYKNSLALVNANGAEVLPCCQPDKVRCKWTTKGGIIPPCEKENLLSLLKWLKNVLGNDIVWYITAGTLLGATRSESHIPHETDIDVNIITKHLGNAHKLIEAHIGRTHFVLNKKTVPNRLFFSPKNKVHVDIWPMIREKDTSKEIQPIKNKGLFWYDVNSTWLFPLKKCKYEGILYPCPRENELWTRTRYGSDWTTPKAKYSNRPDYNDGDGQSFTGLTSAPHRTGVIFLD